MSLSKSLETMDGLKRIYARNCEVRRIERAVAEPFLQSFHRLGYTRCRHLYGLFVSRGEDIPEGTLVAVAGFSAPRVWRKGDLRIRSCEWIRYASLDGIGVDGGMGKLLKAFVEEVRPDDVMSYADASWSEGDVYRKLGFREESPKVFPDGSRSLKFRLKLTDYE